MNNKADWQPVTHDSPPSGVQCLLLTRTRRWLIGYRQGAHWYIPGDGRIPEFMVTHYIMPGEPARGK